MKRTVWKTVLKPLDVQNLEVPVGSEMLCAREQHEEICIWYRCDPDAKSEKRKIAIVGTGNPTPEDGRYIGTASLRGGQLIFHVFVWPN